MSDEDFRRLKLDAARSLDQVMRPPMPLIQKLDPPGKWMRERLIKSIVEFESKLAPDQEIAGRIVNCPGPEASFHILDVGYWGDMIVFHGKTLDGLPMQLLQHHSQVSVLLIALAVEDGAAKRIGFDLSSKLQEKP